MSIDIHWHTITAGAAGSARAESIRAFLHDRFQQVPLPRFIRSVHVHSFEFGSVPPSIEIKDICDPLPDFYEHDQEGEDDSDEEALSHATSPALDENQRPASNATTPSKGHARESAKDTPSAERLASHQPRLSTPYHAGSRPINRTLLCPTDYLVSPTLLRTATPGIPGGTSNINYFHLPLTAGLSGATTPLAAVAGAQLQGWLDNSHGRSSTPANIRLRHAASMNSLTLTPQSNPDPGSRPSSRHQHHEVGNDTLPHQGDAASEHEYDGSRSPSPHRMHEKSPEDIQVVAHVQYSGDIKMSLTAEILLDYPMPSFVGIPLKLNITGITFDGISILAYIKRRAHFCFLSPEDADALVGSENTFDSLQTSPHNRNPHPVQRPRIGGLLEHIKVESEIGGQGSGKQVLKNVEKVESFVLEQVRRIFEEEFVYPSFWTFLV